MTSESIYRFLMLWFWGLLNLCLGLAIFGYFKKNVILAVLSLAILGALSCFFYQLLVLKKKIKSERFTILVLAIVLFIAIFNGIFHHDLTPGRDEMGYLAAAIKLTESGSLAFTDALTHPYHPFRNLGGDTFTSRFLPAYPTYLAIFYSIGGITALFWANALLQFLSLLTIFYLGRLLSSRRAGLLAIFLLATTYLSFWFPRRTVAENLLLLGVLVGAYFIIAGFKQARPLYLVFSLVIFSLLALARGEAFGFLATALLINLGGLVKFRKKLINNWLMSIPVLLWFFLNLLLSIVYLNRYGVAYYQYILTNIGEAIAKVMDLSTGMFAMVFAAGVVILILFYLYQQKRSLSFNRARKTFLLLLFFVLLGGELAIWCWLRTQAYVAWRQLVGQYVLASWLAYYLIIYVLIAGYGFYKKFFTRSVYLVTFLLSPAVVFLFNPNIAVDHPWFMRRFYAALIPLVILLAALTLDKAMTNTKNFCRLAIILIVVNLSLTLPLLTFREYQGVSQQLTTVAEKFGAEDLVLLEPGWQWQQWGYALHYVYQVDVLPNLDEIGAEKFAALLQEYQNVYVISSQRDQPYPGYVNNNLRYLTEINLNYPALRRPDWLVYYVDHNLENLEIAKVKAGQRDWPPREIMTFNNSYYLFAVIDKNQYEFAKIINQDEDRLD